MEQSNVCAGGKLMNIYEESLVWLASECLLVHHIVWIEKINRISIQSRSLLSTQTLTYCHVWYVFSELGSQVKAMWRNIKALTSQSGSTFLINIHEQPSKKEIKKSPTLYVHTGYSCRCFKNPENPHIRPWKFLLTKFLVLSRSRCLAEHLNNPSVRFDDVSSFEMQPVTDPSLTLRNTQWLMKQNRKCHLPPQPRVIRASHKCKFLTELTKIWH